MDFIVTIEQARAQNIEPFQLQNCAAWCKAEAAKRGGVEKDALLRRASKLRKLAEELKGG